jgi:hypothetical protein
VRLKPNANELSNGIGALAPPKRDEAKAITSNEFCKKIIS